MNYRMMFYEGRLVVNTVKSRTIDVVFLLYACYVTFKFIIMVKLQLFHEI